MLIEERISRAARDDRHEEEVDPMVYVNRVTLIRERPEYVH